MHDKYKDVTDMLSAKKPVLPKKEALVRQVMQDIDQTIAKTTIGKVTEHYLFGWANVIWLRKLMAIAAILFFGFFVFEQLTLTQRVTRLEKKGVRRGFQSADFRAQPDLKQKLFLELISRDEINQDSITLSTRELNHLLQSYSDLQERYDKMKHNIKEDSFIDRILKKKFDNRHGKDQGASSL